MHRHLYFGTHGFAGNDGDHGDESIPDHRSCCKVLLEERPIFTAQGTCFYTKRPTFETHPFTWSSVEVWTHFNQDKSPSEFISTILGAFFFISYTVVIASSSI